MARVVVAIVITEADTVTTDTVFTVTADAVTVPTEPAANACAIIKPTAANARLVFNPSAIRYGPPKKSPPPPVAIDSNPACIGFTPGSKQRVSPHPPFAGHEWP
ncbi:hypothetical protein [Rhodoplanes sp. P11]